MPRHSTAKKIPLPLLVPLDVIRCPLCIVNTGILLPEAVEIVGELISLLGAFLTCHCG